MNTNTNPKPNAVNPTTPDPATFVTIANAAVTSADALLAELPLRDALSGKAARKPLESRLKKAPPDLITRVLTLADRSGGQVAGVSVDVAGSQQKLDEATAGENLAAVLRTLVQRLDDDALQKRAELAELATTAVMAMRAMVRTKAGNALRPELADLTAILRRARAPRKPRGAKPGTPAKSAGAPSTAEKPTAATTATEKAAPVDATK